MRLDELARLFAPRRVALVPAAEGAPVWSRIVASNFSGAFHGEVATVRAPFDRAAVDALGAEVDLAVVALPNPDAHRLVDPLVERGCRAMVLVGSQRARAQEAALPIRERARAAGMRVLGPSRLGVIVPRAGLACGAAPRMPHPGPVALLTQSDSLAATLIDWSAPNGVGFSKIVSLGETEDAEFGDLLDYFATDPETRAILLHVDTVADARRFMSAARIASRAKPTVVLRGGRFEEAVHPGATLASRVLRPGDVYHAAFKRAGLVRVNTMTQMLGAAETLSHAAAQSMRSVRGGRLAIVSNGTGPARLAAEALIAGGGKLAPLPPGLAGGAKHGVLDLGADAGADAYSHAFLTLGPSPDVDAILALHAPAAWIDAPVLAEELADAARHVMASYQLPVIVAWLDTESLLGAETAFAARRVPAYPSLDQGVQAFLVRMRYERAQAMLLEIPSSIAEFEASRDHARELVGAALELSSRTLSGGDALELIGAYGVPVARAQEFGSREAVINAAKELGYPVAVEVMRAKGTPLAENAFVAESEAALRSGLAPVAKPRGSRPMERVRRRYVVRPVGRPADALELFVGAAPDPVFGPVVVFGQGGAQAALTRDLAFALPPLNSALARQLMAETAVGRALLEAPCDPAPVVRAICGLSQLIVEQPAVVEVEIRPLWGCRASAAAAGAVIRVEPPRAGARPDERLAVRPYPAELEEPLVLWNGREVRLRPIRPEDAHGLRESFRKTNEEDRRMRLFSVMRDLTDEQAARFTQIDYDREICLVAEDPETKQLLGGARIIADADNRTAEFAVSARSDMKGTGLGPRVLSRVIEHARERGLETVWGTVLAENKAMLAVAERLGFRRERDPDDPELFKVVLELREGGGSARG